MRYFAYSIAFILPLILIPEAPQFEESVEREIDISHVVTWEQTRASLHEKCLRDLRDVKRETEKVPTNGNWRMWEYYIEKCKRLEAS